MPVGLVSVIRGAYSRPANEMRTKRDPPEDPVALLERGAIPVNDDPRDVVFRNVGSCEGKERPAHRLVPSACVLVAEAVIDDSTRLRVWDVHGIESRCLDPH